MYLRKEDITFSYNNHTCVTPWGSSSWKDNRSWWIKTTTHNIHKILGIEAIDPNPVQGITMTEEIIRKEDDVAFPWNNGQSQILYDTIMGLDTRVLILEGLTVFQSLRWGPKVLTLDKHEYRIISNQAYLNFPTGKQAPREWVDWSTGLWKDSQYEYLAQEMVL